MVCQMLCSVGLKARHLIVKKNNTPLQLAQDKKILNLYIKYNETFRLHIPDHTILTDQRLVTVATLNSKFNIWHEVRFPHA